MRCAGGHGDAGAGADRCWMRALSNELQQALKDCNESISIKGDVANTLDSRAMVYLKLGRLDEAIADYDAALKLSPRFSTSLYGRGVAKEKKGDTAGAEADKAAAKAIRSNIEKEFADYGVN